MHDPALVQWLDAHAQALDLGTQAPETLLPRLADARALGVGVEQALGGSGGDIGEAVEAVADIARHSLTAAFVFWGQRSFIEYLLQSPNTALRDRLLPELLGGKLAGATGLSNAMKFLSGIETLQVQARTRSRGWTLQGRLHWVTNLRKEGFVVAAAIEDADGGTPFVLAIPEGVAGLERSDDLQLMGLQSSNTAALDFNQAELTRDWLLHDDARRFLPAVRPAFLGLQCGMSIGLARRSLQEVSLHLEGRRSVLDAQYQQQVQALSDTVDQLKTGLLEQRFQDSPVQLFRLRIALAESAANAVQLELQASGGKAFLSEHGSAFSRRWRESAFVPIVTPSLVQLRGELQRHELAGAR